MKTQTIALLALIPFGVNAQWAVFDAGVQAQLIMGTAQEIAKYAEMINNQISQIQKLTEQINEFKHYKSLFGDPKAVVVAAAGPLVTDLRRTELGTSLQAVMKAADGAQALAYNAAGLYQTVGAVFKTPAGQTVARHTNEFRPFAAVNHAAANFHIVSTNAAARRIELKQQIAVTIDALKVATTDAEVQKLSATLTGLSAALSGAEQEIAQAFATAMVQDLENRNDERKQSQAIHEQRSAAFAEAIGSYGKTFRLLDAATTFPK